MEELDRKLVAAARDSSALRLRVGESLELMAAHDWHHELGYSSLEAYAYERCERSQRWAAEARAMARRLLPLPELRRKLVEGELGWSMVELVARHATPETEAALAAEASSMTVRQMRARLRNPPPVEGLAFRTLNISVDREDLWLLDCTRLLVEQIEGRSNVDQRLHALLAEGLSSLIELLPHGTIADDEPGFVPRTSPEPACSPDLQKGSVALFAAESDSAGHSAAQSGQQAQRPREPRANASGLAHAFEHCPACSSSEALDSHILELTSELARRDLAVGSLAALLLQAGGWRRLGFGSEAQYARERLGLAPSSLRARRSLAAEAERLPGLRAALEHGRIGYVAATLIARVATRGTLAAWVERAALRTTKHLREDVEAAELLVRLEDRRDQFPPSEELMLALANARRCAMTDLAETTAVAKRAAVQRKGADRPRSCQMSGGMCETGIEATSEHPAQPLPLPSTHRLDSNCAFGRVKLRFRVSRDTFELWQWLERCFLRNRRALCSELTSAGEPAPSINLLHFLCVNFWRSWGLAVVPKIAWAHIFARDGFQCSSPVCLRRDVQAHHLKFRSQGGGHEDENLSALCTFCHLSGVHEGRIVALPPASSIRWSIGRKGTLVVHGRRKLAA